MDINKLLWYINRAKTISLPEWQYRFKQILSKKIEAIFPKVPVAKSVNISSPASPFDMSGLNSFDNEVKTFSFFGYTIDIVAPIDFHLDISSGKKFPTSFSKDINIRSDQYGSAKVVWEINRLEFLLPILFEYKKTKDIVLLERFVTILTQWKAQNPYLKGVNWYSNIEVNIRLINWYWCWLLLADDSAWKKTTHYRTFENEVWLPLIYEHCYYSYNNPSYYSSANNHLISEYAGLFIANCLWKFPESDKWLKYAKNGLEKELVAQHSKEGVNKEEAAEYIQFITDFFLLSYVTGTMHHIKFSTNYENLLTNICAYIYTMLDAHGNFPKYGDEDDGHVLLPGGASHSNNFISILNTGAVLFNKPQWKRPDAKWDVKSELLTAFCHGRSIWDKFKPHALPADSSFYANEGHFFFKAHTIDHKEIYAHLDAAPLGFLSIAAHGHADALSFFLNLDGFPFLTDPGTYTYHTHPEWRKYFVSTLAHNTITVNNSDQAKLAGPTMWIQHYNVTLENITNDAEHQSVSAKHDGYLKQGIAHKRTVDFDRKQLVFLLTDELTVKQAGPYHIQMPFHLHPSVEITAQPDGVYVLTRSHDTTLNIQLEIDKTLEWELIKAKDESPLGWYSPSFMIKVPAQVLMGTSNINETISIQTTIKVK